MSDSIMDHCNWLFPGTTMSMSSCPPYPGVGEVALRYVALLCSACFVLFYLALLYVGWLYVAVICFALIYFTLIYFTLLYFTLTLTLTALALDSVGPDCWTEFAFWSKLASDTFLTQTPPLPRPLWSKLRFLWFLPPAKDGAHLHVPVWYGFKTGPGQIY